MNLREEYIKETGNSSIVWEAENGIVSISCDYVEWLEAKFNNSVLADVRLSLPSEEDIFNDATAHGKKLFDADFDTEQLDLIQSSMRFMRDIIIEMNNEA